MTKPENLSRNLEIYLRYSITNPLYDQMASEIQLPAANTLYTGLTANIYSKLNHELKLSLEYQIKREIKRHNYEIKWIFYEYSSGYIT